MKLNTMNSRKNVRGQGMSEYLIIVALVAVAGIAVMGFFGGAARNQVAGIAAEISGQSAKVSIAASKTAGTAAVETAKEGNGLGDYATEAAVE